MIKVVLFDMDGTLVPMDQGYFVKSYLKMLAAKAATIGYDPKELIDAMWKCTYKEMINKGPKTNREAFWDEFAVIFGEEKLPDEKFFDAFYDNEFKLAKKFVEYNPKAAETVRKLKADGFRVALATNPVFPMNATRERISWSGLDPDEFELITAYNNSTCCKPSAEYFLHITEEMGVDPTECLMVGNDPHDDMPAQNVGMKVFLLTDCLLNEHNLDITPYPQGNFDDLMKFIEENK